MRQWLAILTLCVMLLSHGSMGAAVPHGHGHDADHAGAAEQVVVHHADEEHDDHAVAVGDEDAGKATGHAVHTHVVGDLARTADAFVTAPLVGGVRVASMVAAFGPSRGIAPLLEPPSA